MKKYEEFIDIRKQIPNAFALNTLLELGRRNILDDNYYQKMLNNIEKNNNAFMTADYQKETLKIARDMAKVSDRDLYEFIYDKVKEERKLQRGR